MWFAHWACKHYSESCLSMMIAKVVSYIVSTIICILNLIRWISLQTNKFSIKKELCQAYNCNWCWTGNISHLFIYSFIYRHRCNCTHIGATVSNDTQQLTMNSLISLKHNQHFHYFLHVLVPHVSPIGCKNNYIWASQWCWPSWHAEHP